MGKAHQATVESYQQQFAVMDHAVQRFRERADSYLKEGGWLEDEAIRLQLDSLVVRAREESKRWSILDNGEQAELVHLEHASWGSLWALIKENHHRRFPQERAIVTCLTDWMVAQSIIDGRYGGNVPHVPRFARVIEQRMGQHGAGGEGAHPLPPGATPPPIGAGTVVRSPAAEEPRLVVHEGPGGPVYTQLPREAVASHIEQLVQQGIALSAIKVWRPAGSRVRLEFD